MLVSSANTNTPMATSPTKNNNAKKIVEEGAPKWLRMYEKDSDHHMVVEEVVCLKYLRPLGNTPLAFITIFGQARKGKSFLMNKLARSPNLFPVQSSNLPCTIGVDMSPTFMPLQHLCHPEEELADAAPVKERMLVGFLDAEGQGDQGIEYDVHLVAPLLLVSKVMLFNWSGRPARDDILQKLSCLAEAAKRVEIHASDAPEDKIFGHLHLVLRDLDDATGVEEHVFAMEPEKRNSVDALLQRNRIRKILAESFESISVWGFPSPVADSVALNKGEFKTNECVPEFDEQVTALRLALRDQARQPKTFNGKPLTGPLIATLMPEVAQAMNDGVDLLPRSLYEQCEQRTAEAVCKGCKEAFEDFLQELRRQMPVVIDQLSQRLADEQKRNLVKLTTETAELSSKVREQVEEELICFMGKESTATSTENDTRITNKARRTAETAIIRFKETFEVPQRSVDGAVDRQELAGEYAFRSQRALDLFDGEMEGFLEVVVVVRERHDVVRACEGIRDSVISFNEAKIERERADAERKKADEERRRREDAEQRAMSAETRMRELEDHVREMQKREELAKARADTAEKAAAIAQGMADDERRRADEAMQKAEEDKRAAEERERALEEKHRNDVASAIEQTKKEIRPCCPVS